MKTILSLICLLSFATLLNAQKAGTLDSSFGVNGEVITPFYNNEFTVWDAAMQKDNKVVLSGEGSLILSDDTLSGISVIRYQTDGLLDSSFGINGRAMHDFGYYSTGKAIALQTDGKIISAGWEVIDPFNDNKNNLVVVRFLEDGKIDSTFGKKGELIVNFVKNPVINDVVIQPDNKIIIGGSLGPDFFLIRCDDDGKIDSSFGTNGYVTTPFSGLSSIASIVLQPDNKILVGGSADVVAAFARYTSNGSLDQSFGNQGKFTYNFNTEYSVIYNIILLPDGSFIASGKVGGFNENILISKFNGNGTISSEFGNNGSIVVKFNQLQSKAVSAFLRYDNKIVITGSAYKAFTGGQEEFVLCRLLADGNFDSTFGINGITVTDFGEQYLEYTIASFPINDKILTVGAAGTSDIPEGWATLLAQYNNDLSKRQTIISKIKHYIQNYNNLESSSTADAKAASLNINIAPNPVSSFLTIKGLSASTKYAVRITNENGNTVANKQISNVSSYQINVQGLSAGVYNVNILSNNSQLTTLKFIKQ